MSGGNPIRRTAAHSGGVPFTSDDLVVDSVYSKPTVDLVGGLEVATRTQWSSPPATGGAQITQKTILRFQLFSNQPTNRISFALANVPCNWEVRYLDTARGQMVTMTDSKGNALNGTILSQAALASATPASARWALISAVLSTMRTPLVELVLDRTLDQTFLPVDPKTLVAIPYRLSVKGFRLVYVADDLAEEEDVQFVSPTGLLERPGVFRWSAGKAIDGSVTTAWKSPPQPSRSSVVPFYVDLRDATGTGRALNALRLVPLFSGPKMNVYWSQDNRTQVWNLGHRRSAPTLQGAASFVRGKGIASSSGSDAATYPLAAFDASQGWMVGAVYTPNYASGVGGAVSRTVWAFSDGTNDVRVRYLPSTTKFDVLVNGVVVVSSPNQTFALGDNLAIVVGYQDSSTNPNYPAGLYIIVAPVKTTVGSTSAAATRGAVTISKYLPNTMYVGNSAALNASAQGWVRLVWARQTHYFGPAAKLFIANPDDWTQRGTRRSGVMYQGMFLARLIYGTMARLGPGSRYYETKHWRRVPRDFVLHRGIVQLPELHAKFLKLEFTDLVGVPWPSFEHGESVELPQRVLDFHDKAVSGVVRSSPGVYGNEHQREVIPHWSPPVPRSRDTALESELRGGSPQVLDSSYLPPTKMDSGSTEDIERATSVLSKRPGFMEDGRHVYDSALLQPRRHEAFFVGLAEVKVYREDRTVGSDWPTYTERLPDAQNLTGTANWTAGTASDGVLGGYTSTSVGATLTSKTIATRSKWQTLQIAVVGPPWESDLTYDQLTMRSIAHIVDIDGSAFVQSGVIYDATKTRMTPLGSSVRGSSGSAVQVDPKPGQTAPYGIRTGTGLMTGYAGRSSAAVRIFWPDTANGTYELRIRVGGVTKQVERIKPQRQGWVVAETSYIQAGEVGMQAEIVQTDTTVSEPFIVDFLGPFKNPVRVEVSNDGGTTYIEIVRSINSPYAFVTLPTMDNRLRVRITAMRIGTWVGGWSVIPHYPGAPTTVRAAVDALIPFGVSELDELRAAEQNPLFQGWTHMYPRVLTPTVT